VIVMSVLVALTLSASASDPSADSFGVERLSHNWFWHQKYSFFFDLEHYISLFSARF